VNTQEQHFFNTQGFRIAMFALAAVALLAVGAFWFGTGLRADTSPSVAPSPLGSSLTAVRSRESLDYVGRLANSSAAGTSASPQLSRSEDYVGRLANSSAGGTSASPQLSPSEDHGERLSNSTAAFTSASAQPSPSEDHGERLSN
jgi:hypothetical protein